MTQLLPVRNGLDQALVSVIERVPPDDAGLLHRAIRHALLPTGKMARPRLLLAAAQSVGADVQTCVPAAFAVEALHVGSLVHDDIIDDDLTRRGRPSVFGAFGQGIALVAGDWLMFNSFNWAEDCSRAGISSKRVLSAMTVLSRTGHELCRGQVLEEEMARALIMQFDCYLSMVVGKTASLFSASARMGAILGGATPAVEQAWAKIGMEFGIAFQMEDDLIPYRNNGAESGKDPNSDIRNGRITLPWLIAATSGSDSERILLTRGQRMAMQGAPDIPVEAIREVVGRPANLAACEAILERHVAEAIGALSQLDASEGVDMICELLRSSLRRNR